MRAMIITALLLIVSQASASEQVISVQHDSVRGATCWILNDTAISCLPDSSLKPQATATPTREAGRASQANSSVEISPLHAIPSPGDERFQL